jgi:hypothetical protein
MRVAHKNKKTLKPTVFVMIFALESEICAAAVLILDEFSNKNG